MKKSPEILQTLAAAAALFCLGQTARGGTFAQSLGSIEARARAQAQERLGFAGVELAPASVLMRVGDPWTPQNRMKEYGFKSLPPARSDLYDLPDPLVPLLLSIFDPVDQPLVRKIAGDCKAKFSRPWDRIACVSNEVNLHFLGATFTGLRSPCRTIAETFDAAFGALNLPNTWAMHVGADGSGPDEGHVANEILITANTGQVFSYVIDSGWFPGVIFPLNSNALRFHDRDGNGRTDYFRLPAILPARVPTRYEAAPKPSR
ncbi:MAG TPA: hypothetical protein VNH15_08655 [Elusimicrobiota bacterium]|nr:hypothetical protein [Elusimicrobiota bacterium]